MTYPENSHERKHSLNEITYNLIMGEWKKIYMTINMTPRGVRRQHPSQADNISPPQNGPDTLV